MSRPIRLPGTALCTALLCTTTLAGAIFELPSPNPYRNDSWSFGEIVTVGSQDIAVLALGDGFVTSGGIPVGIFRESDDQLLASTNVLGTDPPVGDFRFRNIPPLVLSSGTQYRVEPGHTVGPPVARDGYGHTRGTSLVSAGCYPGNDIIWMASFSTTSTVVPEPSTFALVGAGLLGLTLAVRRRKPDPDRPAPTPLDAHRTSCHPRPHRENPTREHGSACPFSHVGNSPGGPLAQR